jgi:hypothetical protein
MKTGIKTLLSKIHETEIFVLGASGGGEEARPVPSDTRTALHGDLGEGHRENHGAVRYAGGVLMPQCIKVSCGTVSS